MGPKKKKLRSIRSLMRDEQPEASASSTESEGGDEHTGFPEHRLELLDQVVDRRVLPQLHQPQDALDRAGIGGQLAALALVPPDHLRPLGDHGDEAERVHAGELGHHRRAGPRW
ncbi:hypothetical protein PVAP13_2KG065832 [Panicum virgatum]|uniref:Uncharacterized protein n=1 Tax=Panicum virgatum TaxID=38727 RepID=A0A8T0VYJ2_PANVG|nr:hypothetical protein PVAP13_2KG065832 [Panicum virgatum]